MAAGMYGVHMKRVNATEARRMWFSLLDEVAAGEVVVLQRKGRRLVLRREDHRAGSRSGAVPEYTGVLWARDIERADEWTWEWRGPARLTSRSGGVR